MTCRVAGVLKVGWDASWARLKAQTVGQLLHALQVVHRAGIAGGVGIFEEPGGLPSRTAGRTGATAEAGGVQAAPDRILVGMTCSAAP